VNGPTPRCRATAAKPASTSPAQTSTPTYRRLTPPCTASRGWSAALAPRNWPWNRSRGTQSTYRSGAWGEQRHATRDSGSGCDAADRSRPGDSTPESGGSRRDAACPPFDDLRAGTPSTDPVSQGGTSHAVRAAGARRVDRSADRAAARIAAYSGDVSASGCERYPLSGSPLVDPARNTALLRAAGHVLLAGLATGSTRKALATSAASSFRGT
jgi:hypothetical protein